MFSIVRKHEDISRPHAIMILNNFQGFTRRTLKKLEEQELISISGSEWALTDQGYQTAEQLFDAIAREDDDNHAFAKA
jgi:manganese/zinc/iron transport system permease protein